MKCKSSHKITAYLTIFILILLNSTVLGHPAEERKNSEEFIIHYGFNDSHGRSWVRESSTGVVGVSIFERTDWGSVDGTLIYRRFFPDGSETSETVTTGQRLEKSVLLYDMLDKPHIFVARSNDFDQVIDHYSKDEENQWQNETIIHFYNEGGKFIYEISAERGPDGSFHLLVLKSRSDVDSYDFMDAWINSYLYHLTDASGSWEKELVYNYDMAYTYDMCFKSSIRQDLKIDSDGYIHVVFGKQLSGTYDPSHLMYATNKSGIWVVELAFNNDYGPVDDAGWYPSLYLDNDDVPYIACIYLNRVLTHSIMYSKLLLLKRLGFGVWQQEVVCEYDDGYYGNDGRDYTGALCHLVIDGENTPHIIFSDIAATHWDYQRENVGNIRYAVYEDDSWNINTIYRQPLPEGFFDAVEMLWMGLVVSDISNTTYVIGQEIDVSGAGVYTCNLLDFSWINDENCCIGMRGDFNGQDGDTPDIGDIVFMVEFQFLGSGIGPPCVDEADIAPIPPDGSIDIDDLVYMVEYQFQEGPPPAECP